MARRFYSFILYCFFPVILLYFIFRAIKSKDYRGRWSERFGLTTLVSTDVLIHSVSMGETLAALPLIKRLQQDYPHKTITVTTTSPTGSREVIKHLGDSVQHCYLPLDFSICVRLFLRKIRPEYLIIMETELWPNLIHFASKLNVKLMLMNARLSEKSLLQYQKYPFLTMPMLNKLDLIAVQSSVVGKRFVSLGVNENKVHPCGSLKFDITVSHQQQSLMEVLRKDFEENNRFIWIAGSVHPGEFDSVLQAHRQVLNVFSDALLILVPRHPEQFNAAANLIKNEGFNAIRRSEGHSLSAEQQVLLVDTMGELLSFYGIAKLAFVGGTLIKNGGHNPLEPAALGLPVFMGPHYWDFEEIADALFDAGGLDFVDSGTSLAKKLCLFAQDEQIYRQASQAALNLVEENKGSLINHLDVIEPLMK